MQVLRSWIEQRFERRFEHARALIGSRRLGVRVAIGLALVYGTVVLCGPQGIQALMEKHRLIRQLQEQNAAMAQEIHLRETEIEELSNNPDEQQLNIRKKLKLQRHGETTFIIGDGGGDGGATKDDNSGKQDNAGPAKQ